MSVNIELLPRGTTQVSDTPTTKKHDAQCLRDTALTVETFAYSAAGNLPGIQVPVNYNVTIGGKAHSVTVEPV